MYLEKEYRLCMETFNGGKHDIFGAQHDLLSILHNARVKWGIVDRLIIMGILVAKILNIKPMVLVKRMDL